MNECLRNENELERAYKTVTQMYLWHLTYLRYQSKYQNWIKQKGHKNSVGCGVGCLNGMRIKKCIHKQYAPLKSLYTFILFYNNNNKNFKLYFVVSFDCPLNRLISR